MYTNFTKNLYYIAVPIFIFKHQFIMNKLVHHELVVFDKNYDFNVNLKNFNIGLIINLIYVYRIKTRSFALKINDLSIIKIIV